MFAVSADWWEMPPVNDYPGSPFFQKIDRTMTRYGYQYSETRGRVHLWT